MKRLIKETCKLCNGRMQFIFKTNGCKLAQCTRCGFVQVVYQDKIPKYEYDRSYFINNKYKDDNTLRKEHIRRKKMMIKYCSDGSQILDRGCATGEFVAFISDRYQVEGCDISKDAITMAKKKYSVLKEKFWCIAEQTDKKDTKKKYDAVCLWDVVEHISDPYANLLEVKNMLKKNGYLFLSTPNIGAVFARLLKKRWPFMTPPEHLSFFSYQSMKKLADLLNMEIVEWKSKGKWANVGFILYKFNRVSSIKIPAKVIQIFQTTFLSKWNLYVPTCDIQYVVLKNNEN